MGIDLPYAMFNYSTDQNVNSWTQTSFKGSAVHSSEFKSAANHIAHDIAQDFCTHGVDITMYQRSSTFVISTESVGAMLGGVYKDDFPTELADTYNTSLPWAVVRRLHQRIVHMVTETADKEILDGLAKVGFKTNLGIHGAGIMSLFLERGGGYYIASGHRSEFADGTELQADIIVFATGYGDMSLCRAGLIPADSYGDPRDFMREVCGDEVASKITRVWGLDEEGQSAGVWRYCGHDGVWFANGNLALSRFQSPLGLAALLIVDVEIKAIEEGILNKADVVI
ncbi:hypothetical protein EDB19DRAFT_2028260 [Suillus lakei]|nr:hypothetical protein EDB19DRAFT_2028260 [Suillus lakei]